jgi:DnaJ-class molecular chaperone
MSADEAQHSGVFQVVEVECPTCQATGKFFTPGNPHGENCPSCHGTGKTRELQYVSRPTGSPLP